jgi:hypothetical protein
MFEHDTDDAFASFLTGKQDDSACIPHFYLKAKLMGFKSHEAGREIYEDREYVEIRVKGQPKSIFCHEVTQQDKERFPTAYAAFKAGMEAPVIGTPLENLGLSPATVLHFRAIGIRTVEDVAAAGDAALSNMGMGARDIQNKAKALLAGSTTQTVEMAAQIKALQDQLAEVLAAQQPKKRGPKPKLKAVA